MAKRRLSQETIERKQEIVRLYRAAHNNRPASAVEMADWALKNELWRPKPSDLRKQLAHLLSESMREEYFTDPQGRRVRAKHAARVEVNGQSQVLWADMRDDGPNNPELMEVSFQNRRTGIVMDNRQLKIDVDSYNENYNTGEPFQLILDYTDDVAELELAKEDAA
jgi:hypothetical protein